MQQDGNDCASKLRARTLVRSRDGQYEECAQGGGRGGSGRPGGVCCLRGSPGYTRECLGRWSIERELAKSKLWARSWTRL